MPDVLMADTQGVAHPRRMGLAAHIGVLLDMPVLGVAKSRLTGVYVEPDDVARTQSPFQDGDETIGAVLRTHSRGQAPLRERCGNRMTLAEAVALVFATRTRYRMPNPHAWRTICVAIKAEGLCRLRKSLATYLPATTLQLLISVDHQSSNL